MISKKQIHILTYTVGLLPYLMLYPFVWWNESLPLFFLILMWVIFVCNIYLILIKKEWLALLPLPFNLCATITVSWLTYLRIYTLPNYHHFGQ